MSNKILRLIWDDKEARPYYVLLEVSTMDRYWEQEVARGDLEWAHKTAKHYGVPMPKEEAKS